MDDGARLDSDRLREVRVATTFWRAAAPGPGACSRPSAWLGPLRRAWESYRQGWDEARKTFAVRPGPDWASHAADAFRYLAVGRRPAGLGPRPPIAMKPSASSTQGSAATRRWRS